MKGGQKEDKRRTKGGQGQKEDERRTKGGPTEDSRWRGMKGWEGICRGESF